MTEHVPQPKAWGDRDIPGRAGQSRSVAETLGYLEIESHMRRYRTERPRKCLAKGSRGCLDSSQAT